MSQASRKLMVAGAILAAAAAYGWTGHAQAPATTTAGQAPAAAGQAPAAPGMAPVNDVANPYRTIDNFFQRPGRNWGSTSAVEIDKDGRSIWIAERCGSNSCASAPQDDTILHYDANGKLINSFGAGLIIFPHGIHVDADGNVWVTDGNDNGAQVAQAAADAAARGTGGGRGRGGAAPQDGAAGAAPAAPPAGGAAPGADPAAGGGRGRGRGAGAGAGGGAATGAPATTAPAGTTAPAATTAAAAGGQAPAGRGGRGATGPNPQATKGHQVIKFSPDGKVLMTIGRAGGATGPTECCWQPNDVVTNAAGEIFVSEGHGGNPNDRIIKFSKDGKFIQAWGKRGAGPGEFNQPHALAFDSQGRLFVGDRGNNRITVFDKNMNQVADWQQFSRPSGIFIDRNDMLYSADSESGGINPAHGAWKRGIRIGSVKDGKVTAFIPDPLPTCTADMPRTDPPTCGSGTWVAEGVAVDRAGNVYGAEVGPRKVTKYVKK